MNEPTLEQINGLNTEEIVKDLLRGWAFIRVKYEREIRKFRFNNQHKKELRQIAEEFLQKHSNTDFTSKSKVRKDIGIIEDFSSIHIYGSETYPLLAYPNSFLIMEALNPDIFNQIFYQWPSVHVDIDLFSQIFWQKKRSTKARFNNTDLKLLTIFFSHVKTKSSIGFPKVSEIWHPDLEFKISLATIRYRRLTSLMILDRQSIINYARLGLVPLLKIYNRNEVPSDAEVCFSTWETALSPDQSLRILVMPPYSSFWTEHSARDILRLQFRHDGTNVNIFNGKLWQLDFSANDLPLNENIPVPQWQTDYTLTSVRFAPSVLALLKELALTTERRIKYFALRAEYHEGFGSNRYHKLRKRKFFQSCFRLFNAGLNERYHILALGTEKELQLIYQFVCQLPQYYLAKADRCIYSYLWLPTENISQLLDEFTQLKAKTKLDSFYYGRVDSNAKSHLPDLPSLCKIKDEKRIWYSEPEWE
ncbi:MAG: hypothetical protein ACFFBD_08045 [Candidatus Hodarchaeota archaeon]